MTPLGTQAETPQESERASPRPWIGYVVPTVAFMLLSGLETGTWKGSGIPYIWAYTLKVVVVTVALVMYRPMWTDIRIEPRRILPAILIGICAFVMWIYVDRYTPHPAFLGSRKGFNPYAEIHAPLQRALFLLERFYGLTLMVPVMEELFWRSFLLRWLTDPDFARIPLGTFSWSAFWIVTGAFGLAHPEWLAAILFAALMALLLKQTRSLFACVVVHGVTNLLLGLYVLQTGNWRLW